MIASSPPVKQNAIATHSTASVIGGSATLLRSGQGRCNPPHVAVIFAASQKLSVSVVMGNMAGAAGAIVTNALINFLGSGGGAAWPRAKIRCRDRRKASGMG